MSDAGRASRASAPSDLRYDIPVRILDRSYTLNRTMQFVIDGLQRELRAGHVDIMFEYGDELRVEMSSDAAMVKRVIPREHSLSGLAYETPEPILANDLPTDPDLLARYFPRPGSSIGAAPLNSIAARITLEGDPVGVINVESNRGQVFSNAQAEVVSAVATQVSLAIAHATFFDEETLRSDTDALLVLDTGADNDLVVRRALFNILTTIKSLSLIAADGVEVLFVDPQDPNRLVVAHSTNESAIGLRVGIGESVCGQAFRARDTVVVRRPADSDAFRPLQEGMRSEMAIPIQLGGADRFSIGVLNIESLRENAFSRVGQRLAERFAQRVVVALTLAKLRNDVDSIVQDQLLMLAADQVLNAVHRINNYVGAARALANDLIDDINDGADAGREDVLERLRDIAEASTSALAIPDELRKRIVAPQDSVDVNEQVRAGLKEVRVPKVVTVDRALDAGLPNIPCTALDLAVETLVTNAVQAMPSGGQLTVRTYLDAPPDGEPFVVVSITDTGVGMSQSQLDALFERRQTPNRGRGLGFGMVWVKAWVRRANGLIDVQSSPGVGTTVTIRFQIDTATEDAG